MGKSVNRRDFLKGSVAAGAVAGISAMGLAGCSSSSSASSSSSSKSSASTSSASSSSKLDADIVVAYSGVQCELPFFVAVENGFFEKYNITAKLRRTGEGEKLPVLLANGEYNCQEMGPSQMVSIAEGSGMVCVDNCHSGCLSCVAGKDTGIEKPTDLIGKKVGRASASSPAYLLTRYELAKAGLDADQVNWVNYENNLLSTALANGEVDAICFGEPLATKACNDGAHEIWNNWSGDYADKSCCFVGIAGTTLEKDPTLAKRACQALRDAEDYIDGNLTAAVEMAHDKGYIKTDINLDYQVLAHYQFFGNKSGKDQFDRSANAYWMALYTAGLLEDAPKGKSADDAELQAYFAEKGKNSLQYVGEKIDL